MQFLVAFVRIIDRQKESRGIARVDQDRQSESSARLPNRVPPCVIDPQQ